eukprot:TRINITY_DN1246_c0_g1_i1.p1 TRINITY_DN1246_c0_g1~~TRINITY_DN1246_c0_g1_i1.p1  ORF type:complete len:127 (+),score=52.36 TRINITY_DN1246_c0_g1_i1:66-446(+)
MEDHEGNQKIKELTSAGGYNTTAPRDVRFSSSCNQEIACWTKFNEYVMCSKARGEDDAKCQTLYRWIASTCPNDWLDKWEGQVSSRTFIGVRDYDVPPVDRNPYNPDTDAKLLAKWAAKGKKPAHH